MSYGDHKRLLDAERTARAEASLGEPELYFSGTSNPYVDYLNTTGLHSLQNPRSDEAAEMTFYVIGQVQELLFKLLYGELCGASQEAVENPGRMIDAMMRLARQTGLAIEVADHAKEMADVAVHEERRHLALTIHDSVGAILFSIGAATRDLETERECEPALRARLKYIEQQVAKASAQLRQALRSLNEVPQEVALGVALRAECRALEERTGMKAGCVVLGDLPALEEGREKVLLQAAREALHNAEKHARARSVVVSLHAVDGGVSLVVADDGVGLSPPKAEGQADEDGLVAEEGQASTGLGLDATADRLGRVGGQLTISTNEDGGCTMRAWMPC